MLTINPDCFVFAVALGMACHQINLPPMTSTSTRNILPGNQITQMCFTAVQKTEISLFSSSNGDAMGHDDKKERENRVLATARMNGKSNRGGRSSSHLQDRGGDISSGQVHC